MPDVAGVAIDPSFTLPNGGTRIGDIYAFLENGEVYVLNVGQREWGQFPPVPNTSAAEAAEG